MTDTITPASLREAAKVNAALGWAEQAQICLAQADELEAESARDEEDREVARHWWRTYVDGYLTIHPDRRDRFGNWDELNNEAVETGHLAAARSFRETAEWLIAEAVHQERARLAADGRLLPEGGTVSVGTRKYPELWMVDAEGGATWYGDREEAAHSIAQSWRDKESGRTVTVTPPAVSVPNSGKVLTDEQWALAQILIAASHRKPEVQRAADRLRDEFKVGRCRCGGLIAEPSPGCEWHAARDATPPAAPVPDSAICGEPGPRGSACIEKRGHSGGHFAIENVPDSSEPELCPSTHRYYTCTRELGHEGQHEANDGRIVARSWPSESGAGIYSAGLVSAGKRAAGIPDSEHPYFVWEQGYQAAVDDTRASVDGTPDHPYKSNPYSLGEPVPAVSVPDSGPDYPAGKWCPKMMREHLCAQATFAPDDTTRDAFSNLIRVLDSHRPIGPDGKHGNRHTRTCGCEDGAPDGTPEKPWPTIDSVPKGIAFRGTLPNGELTALPLVNREAGRFFIHPGGDEHVCVSGSVVERYAPFVRVDGDKA